MKKLLTVADALLALAAFPGLSVAQKAEEKSLDKTSPILMNCKVMLVNVKKKTFTVTAKGKGYIFYTTKQRALPKIGGLSTRPTPRPRAIGGHQFEFVEVQYL